MHYLLYCLLWNLLLVTLVAAILWILGTTRYLRERPALRHSLWLLVLLKLVTPPIVPLPLLPAPANEFVASHDTRPIHQDTVDAAPVTEQPDSVSSTEVHAPITRESSLNWSHVVSIVMIIAICLSVLVTISIWSLAAMQLSRLRRMKVDFKGTSQRTTEALRRVSAKFNLSKSPALVEIDATCSPMLWIDFRQATIILPRGFEQSTSEERLHHVLAHEIAHLVRHDYISSLIAFFVTSLFWWNPIAWLARREMLIATETCCDALAMECSPGSRQSYAKTLLAAVDYATQNKPVSSALLPHFGKSQSLKRRIEMVASSRVKSALSGASRFVVLSLGLVALLFLPVQAQQEPEPQLPDDPAATEQRAAQDPVNVEEDEKKEEAVPNTAQDNQPKIRYAKLIGLSGAETSSRAYYFESKQAAESFAKLIAAFKIATRIKVVISETEPVMFDADKKRMVWRLMHARQHKFDTEPFVLLQGKRKQHARVEEVMRALDAD